MNATFMGYDFHIARQPEEGWEDWRLANSPADLLQRLSNAEAEGDDDLVFQLQEQVENLLWLKKQAAGLLISEQEWIAAVESTPGARIAMKNPSWTNPKTGEVLSVINSENNVEVADQSGNWRMGIRFMQGRISFSGRAWEPADPIAIVACQLAARLGARIIGDEGESYPLVPGSRAAFLTR